MAATKFTYDGELPASHHFVNPVTGQRDSFKLDKEFSLPDGPACDRALVMVDEGTLKLAAEKKSERNEA